MSRELEPIAPDIDALLDAERHYDHEPHARMERVLERLAATTAALPPPAATAPSPRTGGNLGRVLQTKAAIAIGAAMVGAIGGGIVGYRLGEKAQPPSSISVPAMAPSAAAVEPTPSIVPDAAPPASAAASAPLSAAPAASSARAPVPAAPAPARPRDAAHGDGDLALELSLVQMARAALTRGNYAAALAATEQHARTFPKGHLAEERESLAIQALVGAGRDAEARARAARFRAKYPQSPLLPAVDAALNAIP